MTRKRWTDWEIYVSERAQACELAAAQAAEPMPKKMKTQDGAQAAGTRGREIVGGRPKIFARRYSPKKEGWSQSFFMYAVDAFMLVILPMIPPDTQTKKEDTSLHMLVPGVCLVCSPCGLLLLCCKHVVTSNSEEEFWHFAKDMCASVEVDQLPAALKKAAKKFLKATALAEV